MKLYSIVLYFCILNAVFGFVSTALTLGWWLPSEVVNTMILPQNELLNTALENFTNATTNLNDATTWYSTIVAGVQSTFGIIAIALTFLLSCFSFFPTLLTSIPYIPPELAGAISGVLGAGLAVVSGFTVFQIVTGRWLPFAE